jgi:hypothetical protein
MFGLRQDRTTHMSNKRKPLQVRWTVHDVGEVVALFDFVGCTTTKDPAIYSGGSDGNMLKYLGEK